MNINFKPKYWLAWCSSSCIHQSCNLQHIKFFGSAMWSAEAKQFKCCTYDDSFRCIKNPRFLSILINNVESGLSWTAQRISSCWVKSRLRLKSLCSTRQGFHRSLTFLGDKNDFRVFIRSAQMLFLSGLQNGCDASFVLSCENVFQRISKRSGSAGDVHVRRTSLSWEKK